MVLEQTNASSHAAQTDAVDAARSAAQLDVASEMHWMGQVGSEHSHVCSQLIGLAHEDSKLETKDAQFASRQLAGC